MDRLPFPLNGARLEADLSGALWWPERGWLMVADLHLEKGSAFAERGRMLPPYDTAATLARLEALCAALSPARVVCLGDSFHDRRAAGRVAEADGRRIAALAAATDWVWIAGNHDPAPPAEWGGRVVEELAEGPLVLRHEARPGTVAGEVSGHFHPKAAVRTRGGRITGRCFATSGSRLILPAFGAFTGGLNVLAPAIAGLLAPRFSVILIGRDRLHALPADRLAPDPAAAA
ncbi:MAG TPA: ligase-associated DNA damage response endonuclease PdeM [Azospirillaceae bacterium]|nr:ligase-associated DNA damage response endonuclease PdeM [Azospirillaceae bacterium]